LNANSNAKNTFFSLKQTINCSGKILNLSAPVVMGILNTTPDSFYDGGKYLTEKEWLLHTETMLSEGAAIIDIGAVSTRPGAKSISINEETDRLMPVLKSVRKKFPDTVISVDTFSAAIAKLAVDNGADIINDISAGTFDDKMIETIALNNVPYIIMHIKGTPQNMQINPTYKDVTKEILMFFSERINKLRQAGIKDIIIDPGFGFGKSLEHNYEILNRLDLFRMFELPVLTGFSRKSMINRLLNIKPSEALNGTTVLNTIALTKGAKILRVHDVKPAIEAIKIVSKINY
jgi:dihydropteroate synthase